VLQFAKDTDKYQTHLSFNKGKYNVPNEKYDEFYHKYFEAMQKHEELYLIEKVYNSDFAFFLDLDAPKNNDVELTDAKVKSIVETTSKIICEMFNGENLVEHVVSKRTNKYHVNFCNLIVESSVAKKICAELVSKLTTKDLVDCIDTSVYRTGLRLLGSRKIETKKADKGAHCYLIYNLEDGSHTELEDVPYKTFEKTIVRRKEDVSVTQLKDKYKGTVEVKRASPVKGIENAIVGEEISKFLEELKSTNECLMNFDMTTERVYAKQNKMGMFCYFVSINEKRCPFKQREHQRTGSPLYIEIGMNGVFVKCHDEDCIRQCFPEEGIMLPDDYQTRYSQMYLSMSTKYWKSELTISDANKKNLEESLCGSHYQIAKTAFTIYKNRFRVDEVKNTTWFEFDGVRWIKSHLINILLSEELPKYYKGIKIRDSTVANKDLKDFLVNDEKVDANLRNQMVDNIISKLENVTFKGNILNQITYLYKTHDPDFYTKLDSNPYLIGFKNGVFDFKQNSFRQSTQSDYLTFSTGYDYVEYDESSTQVQEIYDFLSKIITNTKVREYLLKVLGKALIGIPDEKFYIWTGISGANGKSTLINFLENTLGDYTTGVDVSMLTNKRGNASSASPDVARLRGKRIFAFQEPEHDDKLRTGILKQYSGDDTIIARELFKAPIAFKSQGTMIMCCNDLPPLSSIDGGTMRRVRVIEFNSRFCDNPIKQNEFRIDPSVKAKLKEWRPYFMSILIHWYNKYLYEGMNEPVEVLKATDNYKIENDTFDEFFEQCIVEGTEFNTNKTINSNFQSWWASTCPGTKIPAFKDLRHGMKRKYGQEKEKIINGKKHSGFNVSIRCGVNECNGSDVDDC
jgi:P4 family phage/plasmid primase-like protien